MKLLHRTIRHDDGTTIQTSRKAGVSWAGSVTSYVRHNGAFLGTVYHGHGKVEVRPLMGPYVPGVPSVAEAARILVRTNGGLSACREG